MDLGGFGGPRLGFFVGGPVNKLHMALTRKSPYPASPHARAERARPARARGAPEGARARKDSYVLFRFFALFRLPSE